MVVDAHTRSERVRRFDSHRICKQTNGRYDVMMISKIAGGHASSDERVAKSVGVRKLYVCHAANSTGMGKHDG